MVEVREVSMTCDLCTTDRPAVETVTFATDGRGYELDVCERHARQYRDAMATFTAAARRTGGARRRPGASSGASRENAAAIRAWARKKGLTVSERGRISAELAAQYEARTR